eukprot:TRINITY_DN2006_c0_g1_i1.p1 TRINITY_DN2006_c0_g1~~TRINITY_DN2006_c0_g1_i1.p1  ORF type:complete len:1025 (-),score=236.67 TRINITY_DN2006_c0_g1_i1:51-2726(-)
MDGKLDADGEKLTLVNSAKQQVFSFKYSDNWYPTTDGYGASLELACDTSDLSKKASWRASPLPSLGDPLLEYSGSPGQKGSSYSCQLPTYPMANITITEVMYHPVKENSRYEVHEFIEFYNGESHSVSLTNFRVVSAATDTNGVIFTFPSGSSVAAHTYFLVVKSKSAFANVYNVASGTPIFGDYMGELKNGGTKLAIVDNSGQVLDEINYDNKFPWPLAANALGIQDKFIDFPITQYIYKGFSLERVSFNYSAVKTYNWVASLPTPGAVNSAYRMTPLPCATEIDIYQLRGGKNDTKLLTAGGATIVAVKVSPPGSYTNVRMEYYIDDIYVDTETTQSVDLQMLGDKWYYTFENGFPENSIVRYRIRVDVTGGSSNQVISPRSNDPIDWHGLFVNPNSAITATSSNTYFLFLRKDNWDTLWDNLDMDTTNHFISDDCCTINENWNSEVKAVFAYEGKAYDVLARYQGSNYNRFLGDQITDWTFDGPNQPSTLLALSWKITFPDWLTIDDKSDLTLLKPRDEGCSFPTTYVMYELARQLGMPAPKVKFSRLFINGGYYLYAMDVDYFSSAQIQDYIDSHYSQNCRNQTSEEVGFMFKAQGFGCEGPMGPGDEEYLYDVQACGTTFTTMERTQNSYNIETHSSWVNYTDLVDLTDHLSGDSSFDWEDPAVLAGAAKTWFKNTFDVNLMLNYIALIDYAGAWDDISANHMIYQRITDGKWFLVTWDMDSLFGRENPAKNATTSLYLGEEGAPVSDNDEPGAYNTLKDHFIKTFRTELNERYRLLASSVLSPANVNAIADKAMAEINMLELQNSPTGYLGSECITHLKSWNQLRNNYVTDTLGSSVSTTLNTCPDKPTVSHITTPVQDGAEDVESLAVPVSLGWAALSIVLLLL